MADTVLVAHSDGVDEVPGIELDTKYPDLAGSDASVLVILPNEDVHFLYGAQGVEVKGLVKPTGALVVTGIGRTYGPAGWVFADGDVTHAGEEPQSAIFRMARRAQDKSH